MAIVTGEERIVEGDPGELSPEAYERAQKAIEARRKQRAEERRSKPDHPKPDETPEGFKEPIWSTSQRRWVCSSKTVKDKWCIWEKKKWCDFDAWEKSFEANIPDGFKAPEKTQTWYQKVKTFLWKGESEQRH